MNSIKLSHFCLLIKIEIYAAKEFAFDIIDLRFNLTRSLLDAFDASAASDF